MGSSHSIRTVLIEILGYAIALLLILECRSVWTSSTNSLWFNGCLLVGIAATSLLYLLISRISIRTFRRVLFAWAVFTCFFVVFASVTQYNLDGFFTFVLMAASLYSLCLAQRQNVETMGILLKYRNLMLIIAAVSLFFWVFGPVLGWIQPTGFFTSTWTGNQLAKAVQSYYGLYFYPPSANPDVVRNSAIFTEGPMYSYVLCIAFLIEIFLNRKPSAWKYILLGTAILSTSSTTGWCTMILAVVWKLLLTRAASRSKVMATLKWGLMVVVIPLAAAIFLNLILAKADTTSGSIRLDDFIAGFKAWKANPLFGAGYGNSEFVKQFMSGFRSSNQGFSNAPMRILSQGGIFLFALYAYFALRWICASIRQKDMKKLAFFVCFLFMFIFTSIAYQALTLFIFFSYELIDEKYSSLEPALPNKVLRRKYRIRFTYGSSAMARTRNRRKSTLLRQEDIP